MYIHIEDYSTLSLMHLYVKNIENMRLSYQIICIVVKIKFKRNKPFTKQIENQSLLQIFITDEKFKHILSTKTIKMS